MLILSNKDCSLSINKLNLPKVYENLDALEFQIRKLLLMEKGTYESVPNMGVGIRNYRYNDIDNVNELRDEIQNQITTYLPYFQLVEVTVKNINNKTVTFNIVLDDNLLQFRSNSDDYTLENITIGR